MRLFFFSNNISTPRTGGEIYNSAILEGARNIGLVVKECEMVSSAHRFRNNFFVCNIRSLFFVLRSKKNDLIFFDTCLHARCFFSIIVSKFVLGRTIIGMLHHYSYLDKKTKIAAAIHFHLESIVSSCFSVLITNSHHSLNNFQKITDKRISYYILAPFSKSLTIKTKKADTDINNRKIRFLHIGSIIPRKNIHIAIQALCNSNINFQFDVIGEFVSMEYEKYVRFVINENLCENRVILHGFLEADKVGLLTENADIFILMSTMEGYGMAIAEAIAAGLPIISSNRGAIPEMVEDGVNGYLCEPSDVSAVTQAIRKICAPAVMEKMSINNQLKAKSFTDRAAFVETAATILKSIEI